MTCMSRLGIQSAEGRHRLGFTGLDAAEMVLDLLVLRIVGSKDKLAFGNRIGPQRTQLQRDRAVGGHFRPANTVNVLARERLTASISRRVAPGNCGGE